MLDDTEHIFTCLISIWISFAKVCLHRVLYIFLWHIVCHTQTLQIFSPISCFISFLASFKGYQLKILIKYNSLYFSVTGCVFKVAYMKYLIQRMLEKYPFMLTIEIHSWNSNMQETEVGGSLGLHYLFKAKLCHRVRLCFKGKKDDIHLWLFYKSYILRFL